MDANVTAPKRGKVREQILRAAQHLFTKRGFFNTSVQEIQRVAGVSIGSIYKHFEGKEGIAKALYTDLVARMNAFVDEAITGNPDAYTRGKALIGGLFEITEASPETIGFVLGAKHREFLPEEPPICSSEPFERMRDVLKQGMDSGEVLPMDLMIAASCAYGPALRMISFRLDGLLAQPLPPLTDEVWSAAWRSIRK